MTIQFKRKSLIASTLALGLFATLQLPQALAKDKGNDRAEPRMQHGDMMNHGQRGDAQRSESGTAHYNSDRDRAMQQMNRNQGQMDHGNMGSGRMNHGSIPPAPGKGKGHNDNRY
ncbi:hypothetical protein ACFPTX_01570 [Pseudomonas sp. GCM10022188]|uniref:hypothetical protein n=1 Tax=Pseudomonas TaxID=286 RepID=UPI001E3CDC61|nr:hypothetical protein [Pseudomonas oryzagri]MCC6075291.1 hypothetical protein [Pseudomonas oryzagri]